FSAGKAPDTEREHASGQKNPGTAPAAATGIAQARAAAAALRAGTSDSRRTTPPRMPPPAAEPTHTGANASPVKPPAEPPRSAEQNVQAQPDIAVDRSAAVHSAGVRNGTIAHRDPA